MTTSDGFLGKSPDWIDGYKFGVDSFAREMKAARKQPTAEPGSGSRMTHDLKTWPQFFDSILSGEKTFELRKNDRKFHVDDVLLLREWHPADMEYTGRTISKRVTHLLHHDPDAGCAATFGLKPGFVIMSLSDEKSSK